MANFFRENKIIIWSVIAGLVFFIFYSRACDILAGEKGQVKKFVLQGKKAVESKKISTCANLISTDYHDKYGNDRQSLIFATRQMFDYYRRFFVYIEDMKIELDDSKTLAEVKILALVIGQTQQNNAEKILEGEKGRFRIQLIKEYKKWQLLKLEFFEPITIMGRDVS